MARISSDLVQAGEPAAQEEDELDDEDPAASLEKVKATVLARIAREEREEKWRFKRQEDQARLARETDRARTFRLRADKAERDAANLEPVLRERVEDVEAAALERRDRCANAALAAKTRLQEAETQREEVEAQCRSRVQEAETLLQHEKAHTAEVEALLLREKSRAVERWRQVEAAEELGKARLSVLDSQIEVELSKARQREQALARTLEEREREVQRRCEAEVQAAKVRLQKVKELCRERVEMEASRKAKAEEEVQDRLEVAQARLHTDRACTRQALETRVRECRGMVDRARMREEANLEIGQRVLEASIARTREMAATKSDMARQWEANSKASLEATTYVLGRHYATTREYRPAIDGKISDILQGCLHGKLPEPHSARALPPPASMATARERREPQAAPEGARPPSR